MSDWLVIASVCDCHKVALPLMSTDSLDPNASLEAEGDHEAVALCDDWPATAERLAIEMHTRTGLRVSGACTVVCAKRNKERLRNELVDLAYRIADSLDKRTAPVGAR